MISSLKKIVWINQRRALPRATARRRAEAEVIWDEKEPPVDVTEVDALRLLMEVDEGAALEIVGET